MAFNSATVDLSKALTVNDAHADTKILDLVDLGTDEITGAANAFEDLVEGVPYLALEDTGQTLPTPLDDRTLYYVEHTDLPGGKIKLHTTPELDDPVNLTVVGVGGATLSQAGAEVRISIDGGTTQGEISDLAFQIDHEDLEDLHENVAIVATGVQRIAPNITFRKITHVIFAALQAGTGAYARALDKNATSGPSVQVFDNAGTRVTETADIVLRGY